MSEKIEILPYDSSWDSQLRNLAVTDDQLPYVGTVEALLEHQMEGWCYQVICREEKAVGFFNLDELYGERYEFADEKDLGFRAFFIDRRYQGMGIGSLVLKELKAYVSTNYPHRTSVVLTVNCKNKLAYQLYVKCGFQDDGDLYHGGNAGPQHILRMNLT